MAMQQTVNERFSELVNFYAKGNVTQFAREIGAPQPTINSIIKGKTKEVKSATLMLVLDRYPEVNMTWLLSGQGNMIIGNSYSFNKNQSSVIFDKSSQNMVSAGIDPEHWFSLREQLAEAKEKIAVLNIEIAKLKDELEREKKNEAFGCT